MMIKCIFHFPVLQINVSYIWMFSRVVMVKVQYLSGLAGTVAIRRTAVTVTAIPTVFIRCQSVACPSKERSLGI